MGKSTIAWELFRGFEESARRIGYVDIDQLGMCYPEPEADPTRDLLKARNLGAVVQNLSAAGADGVIVSGVADEAHAPMYVRHAPAANLEWVRIRLDRALLHHRLVARGFGAADIAAVERYAGALDRSTFAGFRIETSGRSIPEVVSRVRDEVGAWPPPRHPLNRHQATTQWPDVSSLPVLWVSGPTAVGKSAVAWQVFEKARRAGVRAALVDVRQLGFLQPPPGGDPENHTLEARNIAALWSVFQSAGARCLVISGAARDPAAVAEWVRLVPSETLLTVCRLHASAEALTHRTNLRVQGPGWRETGDPLLDASANDVSAVVASALAGDRVPTVTRRVDIDLETTGLTPEEIADAVVARARGWRDLL